MEKAKDMEMYAASLLHLLRDISEAISHRKESETDYNDLLQRIFEKEGLHTDPEVQTEVDVVHLSIPKLIGREHEMGNLLLKCLNPYEKGFQLSAIPILGDSGIGKTTFARSFYEETSLKRHFEMRVWVEVHGQGFNLHHAAQEILKSTMGMACSLDDLDELDEMVRDTLQWRRCLIVFDGVESMTDDHWLHMNKYWFDFVDVGSKLLITTSSRGVANLVANEPFELKQLHPSDAWSLAFESTDIVTELSSQVVLNLTALCGCVPLLLKLVGSTMRHDDKLSDLLSSVHVSHAISLSTFDASVAIFLCIWALPLQLRQCLAFCAIFPKGYALNGEKIINMWVAHGLVKPSPKNNLHDIGHSYFHQLLCRSFFTDISRNEYGDITEFRMPGLIHTIMKDVVSIVLEGKVGVIGSISDDAHQLSLHSESAGKHMLEDVRTLIPSSTLYSGASSLDYTILDFLELQSLDLSCSGIRNLSDDICALTELRYLNLSYTLIERLPDSITDLSRLETLDLSCCYHFKVLPKAICNLTYMTHLDLFQCESLSYLPSGIGFLASLTSMPLFVLGKDEDNAGLRELGQLNKLRGKLEIKNLENATQISEARDARLDDKNLHRLGLSWSQNADNCFEILKLLAPNTQLQDLDITGYSGSAFPLWISSIHSLMKISLTDCGIKELPSLGQLPVLKELQLKGMTNLDHIGPEFYGDALTDVFFPSLQQLGLYDLPMLSEWSGETSPNSSDISFQCLFQSLKTLTIEACPNLTSLPPLPTLCELIVGASNEAILSSLASFTSLSSLLINDMELGASNFQELTWLDSLNKLILFNVKDKLIVNISRVGTEFTALQHLGILHCHQLTDLCLFYFSSLQKLHVVNCPNLYRILVREEEETPLVELVIEDCPGIFSEVCFGKFPSLRKLIGKNCGGDFTIYYAGDYKKLKKLEYLFINGCSRVEREVKTFPSLISHVPCIIMGDHKVFTYEGMENLIEVPTRVSYESKAFLNKKSYNKGFGRTQRCFGALCLGDKRVYFGFFTAGRRTTDIDSYVIMPL